MEATSPGRPFFRHSVVALAGTVLALVIFKALSMELRYAGAVVAGILLMAGALFFVGRLSDLLVYVLAFNLPFTSIEKTLFLTTETTFVESGVPVGLFEICLFSLYLLWFVRIFVEKKERLPVPRRLDWWVLAFLSAHILSLLSATSRGLAVLEIVRLAKYSSMYFYLAHNLRRRHLKWVVAALMSAILIQSSLALIQYRSGHLLGIGRTKGSADQNYEQYEVTGFESISRAEGTTFDSHALTLFLAMTLPLPLAMALATHLPLRYRVVAGIVFCAGIPGLVVGFARGGWAAFGGACLVLLLGLSFGSYRRRRARLFALLALGGVLGVAILLPFAAKIQQRLFEAPKELVTARFDTLHMGIQMWKHSPWTGLGANNYMHALELEFSIFEGDPYFIPAHNMLVFILTEIGVVGIAAFLAFSVAVCRMNWKVIRKGDPLAQNMATALLAGFAAFQIEGISDPIYATTVTYFLLWFQLGVAEGVYNVCFPGLRTSDARLNAESISRRPI